MPWMFSKLQLATSNSRPMRPKTGSRFLVYNFGECSPCSTKHPKCIIASALPNKRMLKPKPKEMGSIRDEENTMV